MKKKLSALLVCLFSAVLALALVACGGNLTISDTSLALTAGDTKQLTLKDGETDVTKDAEWESSDTKIVTVDKGKVTAKSAGEATVKGSYKSSSLACTVTVKAKEVVKIAFTDESGKDLEALTLERGESVTVKATTSNGSKVSWGIADPKYATVEQTAENTAKITAKFQTPTDAPVSVTATSGSGRGDLPLTVTYLNAPAGYYEIGHYEQNKVPVNTWGRWANQNWEGGGDIDMNISEYQDSADSEAGIATFNFTVDAHGTLEGADLQVVYRSAGEDGKLETGKQYALSMDVTSSMAGSITLNGMDFTIEAGKKTTITSYFLHADDGAIHEEGDWKNIYYTGVFLLLGNLGEAGDTIDFRIENVHWNEFTAEQLKAPTVTLSGNNATIADDVNTEGVAGYNLGLFVGDRQVYVIPDAKKGENSLGDLSKYEEAEYAVKAQAVGTDARYTDSPWSEGGATINVVHGGKTEYDVIEGDENQAKALPGLWYYSSEFGGMTNVKYASSASNTPYGEVSFEITNGGNWHSNQLFFVNSRLAAGRYVVKFTLAASGMEGAGKVHINGKIYTIENGDNAIEYRVEQNVGVTTISIQMGEPDEGYQSTVSSVEKGTFTLKGFSFDAATAEKLATPTGLTIAEDGTVTITDAASNTGKVSGYKLIFVDASGATKAEKVVKNGGKLDVNTIPNGTYTIKVVALGNDIDWTDSDAAVLKEGFVVDHEDGPIQMEFGGEADEGSAARTGWAFWNDQNWNGSTVTVSEALYELKEDGTYDVSAKFSATGKCDWGFQLYYNDGAYEIGAKYLLTLTATAATDCTVTFNGKPYSLKAGVPTEISVEFTYNYHPDNVVNYDAGLSLFDMQVVVANGMSYELTFTGIKWEKLEAPAPTGPDTLTTGGEGDAKTASDGWKYWSANNERNWVEQEEEIYASVEVTEAKREGGVITLKFKGTAKWLDYGFQLFYNDPTTYPVGSQYKLTLHVKATYACSVTFNGQTVAFTAGEEKDVEVTFTYNFHLDNVENYDYGISLFDMQVKTEEGKDYALELSNIKWEKVGGTQPETPAGDKAITVTPTEWYGNSFVKLSMSDEDFALVKTAANCRVNNAEVQPHGGNKGFLVDGTVLQVQLPEPYGAGKTYSVVWYDAQGNAIAHATFSYSE